MTINNRIKAFITLGNFLNQFSYLEQKQESNSLNELFYDDFKELISIVHIHNAWFVEENVKNAIGAIAASLEEEKLIEWISGYIKTIDAEKKPVTVAVIMAGNIPMVGFHDMLCVLLSGNKFVGKLSSDDKLLLPFVAKVLVAIEP
ncbi:MAG: acyl-CoA reductase, partial [Bacteroidia bacterium]